MFVYRNMNKIILLSALILSGGLLSCQNKADTNAGKIISKKPMETSYKKTDEEWKKILTPEQYYVLRQKGTERPHTSELNLNFDKGVYTCAGCGTELFTSDQKFDSHCGWPSFDNEIGNGERIIKVKDFSHGMIRTEIICAKCGGHLGHIFDDGPTNTGQRYCVNGLSLQFKPEKDKEKK